MLLACATPTSAQEIMMDDTVGVGSEPVESEKFPLVLELKETAVIVPTILLDDSCAAVKTFVLLLTVPESGNKNHPLYQQAGSPLAPITLTNPLYVVDGQVVGDAKMKPMGVSDVWSISALRGDSAVKYYGKTASGGMVRVVTAAWASERPGKTTKNPLG